MPQSCYHSKGVMCLLWCWLLQQCSIHLSSCCFEPISVVLPFSWEEGNSIFLILFQTVCFHDYTMMCWQHSCTIVNTCFLHLHCTCDIIICNLYITCGKCNYGFHVHVNVHVYADQLKVNFIHVKLESQTAFAKVWIFL